ncbi:MAG: nucleoside deaminase [Pseudomonadota bacterium]
MSEQTNQPETALPDDRRLRLGIAAAYEQAKKSFDEGGVPVGASLMIGDEVVAVGHNRRVQQGSSILHGETDCIERAGHEHDLSQATLFTTLSPCTMCAGAIRLFRIPEVVILDSVNTADYETTEEEMSAHGVRVRRVPHEPSIELNRRFQQDPVTRRIWLGDVGI